MQSPPRVNITSKIGLSLLVQSGRLATRQTRPSQPRMLRRKRPLLLPPRLQTLRLRRHRPLSPVWPRTTSHPPTSKRTAMTRWPLTRRSPKKTANLPTTRWRSLRRPNLPLQRPLLQRQRPSKLRIACSFAFEHSVRRLVHQFRLIPRSGVVVTYTNSTSTASTIVLDETSASCPRQLSLFVRVRRTSRLLKICSTSE